MNVISITRRTTPLVDLTVSMEGVEARVKSFDQALTFSMHRKHGVPRPWPERSRGSRKLKMIGATERHRLLFVETDY